MAAAFSVFFVPGPRGGGAFYDCFGPPWTKHPCTNREKPYSPYGRSGKPKLRNRRSEFEKDGWLPFFVRNIESLASGFIIHGVAMNSPTVLHFGSLDIEMLPDKERPVYFRYRNTNPKTIDINFFPIDSIGPISETMFDDCRSHFDLLLKVKK